MIGRPSSHDERSGTWVDNPLGTQTGLKLSRPILDPWILPQLNPHCVSAERMHRAALARSEVARLAGNFVDRKRVLVRRAKQGSVREEERPIGQRSSGGRWFSSAGGTDHDAKILGRLLNLCNRPITGSQEPALSKQIACAGATDRHLREYHEVTSAHARLLDPTEDLLRVLLDCADVDVDLTDSDAHENMIRSAGPPDQSLEETDVLPPWGI
jgi:hypothetical protein